MTDAWEFTRIEIAFEACFLRRGMRFRSCRKWLYTDVEDASAAEFTECLVLLKAKHDPIFFRCSSCWSSQEVIIALEGNNMRFKIL
ncbi:hypothetical protein C5167_002616 [Papaver somniferum]|uniref:Uncharacterized protein n=1 Tax=Papaver somniferum TaxID=3469 RepID=A0A4Y7L2K0_PAPSO|nr:hypothetical protein C5167_002616 [Papaver somniferum]